MAKTPKFTYEYREDTKLVWRKEGNRMVLLGAPEELTKTHLTEMLFRDGATEMLPNLGLDMDRFLKDIVPLAQSMHGTDRKNAEWGFNPTKASDVERIRSMLMAAPEKAKTDFAKYAAEDKKIKKEVAQDKLQEFQIPLDDLTKPIQDKPQEFQIPLDGLTKPMQDKPREFKIPLDGLTKPIQDKPQEFQIPLDGLTKPMQDKPREFQIPLDGLTKPMQGQTQYDPGAHDAQRMRQNALRAQLEADAKRNATDAKQPHPMHWAGSSKVHPIDKESDYEIDPHEAMYAGDRNPWGTSERDPLKQTKELLGIKDKKPLTPDAEIDPHEGMYAEDRNPWGTKKNEKTQAPAPEPDKETGFWGRVIGLDNYRKAAKLYKSEGFSLKGCGKEFATGVLKSATAASLAVTLTPVALGGASIAAGAVGATGLAAGAASASAGAGALIAPLLPGVFGLRAINTFSAGFDFVSGLRTMWRDDMSVREKFKTLAPKGFRLAMSALSMFSAGAALTAGAGGATAAEITEAATSAETFTQMNEIASNCTCEHVSSLVNDTIGVEPTSLLSTDCTDFLPEESFYTFKDVVHPVTGETINQHMYAKMINGEVRIFGFDDAGQATLGAGRQGVTMAEWQSVNPKTTSTIFEKLSDYLVKLSQPHLEQTHALGQQVVPPVSM